MKYKGFYIDITPCDDLICNDSSGNDVVCKGYRMSVFRDEAMTEKFDEFTAAVGYEILAEDIAEAEQFAKDVVSCEDKALINDQPELVIGGM